MTITAPDAPTLPSLNDPANFNTRALALFSWLVTEYIPWLETLAGVTDDGEINGTLIGQKSAAAGKFTTLLADNFGGAGVQTNAADTTGDAKLVRLDGVKAAALSRFGVYKSPSSNFDIDTAEPGFAGLVYDGNPGTWPRPQYGAFVYLTTDRIYFSDSCYQTATYGYSSSGAPNQFRQYKRVRSSDGIWGPWYQVYNGFSLVGTVSQSDGTPTGAVIEKGDNANGEYVRFADGTQICWCRKPSADSQNISVGGLYRTAGQSLVFPAAFVDATKVQVLSGNTGDTAAWFTMDDPNEAAVHVRRLGIFSSATNIEYRVTAIGRWF